MTSTMNSAANETLDPRTLLDRAIATGAAVIGAINIDQLADPTPCDEMDVRAMLGHLVGILDRINALGRGEDPFAVIEREAQGDRWLEAWSASSGRAVEAWRDDAVLDGPMALPWIQGTGATVLASYYSELTVHTWDLAVATDQQPQWDDHVVAAALEACQFLPAENRLEMFEQISAAAGFDEVAIPFAEAITVADDAPAIDRLVAYNGRNPAAPLS